MTMTMMMTMMMMMMMMMILVAYEALTLQLCSSELSSRKFSSRPLKCLADRLAGECQNTCNARILLPDP